MNYKCIAFRKKTTLIAVVLTGIISLVLVSCRDDDKPTNVMPAIEDQTFAVKENAAKGTAIGTVDAEDKDGDVLTFSITAGNTGDAFLIDAATGEIMVSGALDYETTSTYTLEVGVSDGVLSGAADVIINITDIRNEHTPVMSRQTFSIVENAAIGTAVGTVDASDEDGDVLTFSITAGNTDDTFRLDAGTGEITVAGALDYETTSTYTLQVSVLDGALSDVADVIIDITDIRNEHTPVMSGQTFSIAENAATGTSVGTVVANDEDGDALNFTITAGNTGDAFQINAGKGGITVKSSAPLDFETMPTFTLTIEVSDGDFLVSASVTVNLTDVDEGPVPCPHASPTPFITYNTSRENRARTLYDSMRVAISKKSLPELRRLIACSEERANVTIPNVLQFPILSLLSAILNESDFEFSVKVAEVLIDNGADIERGGFIDRTPLEQAANSGNLPLVKFLVMKGARQKSRAMIRAVDGGDNVEIVKFLLSEGANIFTQAGVFTENILQSAAGFGHLDIVKFLVADGRLNIDFAGKDGTPLERAARGGHLEVVKHLLDKGADIDKGIQTPLLRACNEGALAIVKELVKRGADVNKADIFGQTPLMFAVLAQQNGLEIMKVLVEQGKADLKKVDNDGKTVLDFARRIKDRRSSDTGKAYIQTMIDYLVSKGAPE